MIEPAIRAILIADSAVTTLASTRIRPVNLAADEAVSGNPCVAYQVLPGQSIDCLDAEAEYITEPFQIDCFAATYPNAKALASAVKDALHYYSGTIGGIVVAHIQWEGTTDETAPADIGMEVPIYHLSLEFSSLIKPSS